MDKDQSRLSRLISILTSLQTKSLITSTELAERYDISTRTVYRDIRTLIDAGIPIYTVEGKGYSLMSHFNLAPISFTEEEAHAFITAEKLILSNKDESLRDSYSKALEKVRAVINHSKKQNLTKLSDRMLYVADYDGITSNHLSAIQKAIVDRKLLSLDYISFYKSEKTSRVVEPMALYNTRDNWILIAWCRTKDNYREFRLDRILDLLVLSTEFEEKDFDLGNYFQRQYKFDQTPDIPLSSDTSNFTENYNNMEEIRLVGIKTRTANDGRAMQDIPQLWSQFLSLETQQEIPEKLSKDIYCVYTEYEGDHTKPYTIFLGYPVTENTPKKNGISEMRIQPGQYKKYLAKGNIQKGSIWNAWKKIWADDLERAYKTDYEIYGQKAINPLDAEVEIYVGLK